MNLPNEKLRFFPELESIRGLVALTVLIEHWVSFQRIDTDVFIWLTDVTLDMSCIAVLVFLCCPASF